MKQRIGFIRERAEALTGLLVALLGGFIGLAAWAAQAEVRARAGFESGPNWSVLYAELPLTVLVGAGCALAAWWLPRVGGLRLSGAGAAGRAVLVLTVLTAFWLVADGWYAGLPVQVPDVKP
ncbi:hypothetical protein [Streptomyces albipurpureus]|uniref:Integral membrane protein n=1 Tax=Streptomyces albipurpureus TaxID=2897419 RepID=A0ABT0UYB5_9ACTN|nr:hypothetical protein [Streptomyces sp. CWNU-1]MCM2392141.1 hypothetical protein [Streptomyces sp. CWNU-1]